MQQREVTHQSDPLLWPSSHFSSAEPIATPLPGQLMNLLHHPEMGVLGPVPRLVPGWGSVRRITQASLWLRLLKPCGPSSQGSPGSPGCCTMSPRPGKERWHQEKIVAQAEEQDNSWDLGTWCWSHFLSFPKTFLEGRGHGDIKERCHLPPPRDTEINPEEKAVSPGRLNQQTITKKDKGRQLSSRSSKHKVLRGIKQSKILFCLCFFKSGMNQMHMK